MAQKRSFFERLTGSVRIDEDEEDGYESRELPRSMSIQRSRDTSPEPAEWAEETEGELTVDMYQTPDSVVVKTMTAGVKPDDLDISISRDSITIKGRRETAREVNEEDYFHRELYWGTFSRTLMLPAEVDVENSQAVEKHGLVIITMPKINKERQTKLRVKSN